MRKERQKRLLFARVKVFGFSVITIFVIILFVSSLIRNNSESHSTVLFGEMNESKTINGFYKLDEYVKYLSKAIETEDIDMFLRGCAIEERTNHYPFTYLMNHNNNRFSYTTAFLPSGSYEIYQPVNQMLIADDYLKQLQTLYEQLREKKVHKKSKIKINTVRVLEKDDQLEKENLDKNSVKAKRWGAELLVELAAYVDVGGETYTYCFTVARYDGIYKLFRLQGSYSGWTSDVFAVQKDLDEYNEMTAIMRLNDFASDMEIIVGQVNSDIDVGNKTSVDNPEEAVLPLNYYVVDQLYGNSPEDACTLFMTELLRNNPKKALNYMYIYGDDSANLKDIIVREGEVMTQLSYLFKGLAKLPYAVTVDIDYKQLDFKSSDLIGMLDPSPIHTFAIHQMYNLYGETKSDVIPYNVLCFYNNQNYKIAFTMKKTQKGWQVYSLASYINGISPGEVVNITKSDENEE